jgi:hypothetical protein
VTSLSIGLFIVAVILVVAFTGDGTSK